MFTSSNAGALVLKVGHRFAPSLERGRSCFDIVSNNASALVWKVGHRFAPSLARGRNA
jgi:hypothetical protein